MAQHDYNIANADGATVRADLNSLFDALATQNSGDTAPTTTFAFMPWMDTANNLLKVRNAANNNWVVVASLSGTTWTPYLNGSPLGGAAILGASGAVGDVIVWGSDGASPAGRKYPAGDGSALTNLGGGPYCRAILSGTQALTKNVLTKITFDSTTINSGAPFDTVNHQFKPLTAGTYRISITVICGGTYTTTTGFAVLLKANGSTYLTGGQALAGANEQPPTVTIDELIAFNGSTDYVEVWIINSGTTPSVIASNLSGNSEVNTLFTATFVN